MSSLDELEAEARSQASNRKWGSCHNTHAEIAKRLWAKGEVRVAMRHYMIKAILGLQGGENIGALDTRLDGVDEFSPDLSFLGKDIVVSCQEYIVDRNGTVGELREVFNEAADAIWRDRFPRSRQAVWGDIREAVQSRLERARLRERIRSAGSDLLTVSDAKQLVEDGDVYGLAGRVWTLLKSPSWESASDTRIQRAEYYLNHIELRDLSERWTARMLRRLGEIRQWYGDHDGALAHYEAALKRREDIGVKRVTKRLRKTVAK